jgi:hypothetical protein
MHGRPIPFNGTSYAQLYAHFKPTAGWVGNSKVQNWGPESGKSAAEL